MPKTLMFVYLSQINFERKNFWSYICKWLYYFPYFFNFDFSCIYLKAHFQIYPFIRWLKPILIDDEKKNSSHCCWYFLSPLEERSAFLSQVLSPIFHPKRKTDEKWPQKTKLCFSFCFWTDYSGKMAFGLLEIWQNIPFSTYGIYKFWLPP